MQSKMHPGITAAPLVFNKKGELLLVKSTKGYGDVLMLPGGHVELFESIKHAAVREAKEETGLTLRNVSFLCYQEVITKLTDGNRRHHICFCYVCKTNQNNVKLNRELNHYEWVNPRKALRMNTAPYTKYAIKIYLKRNNPPLKIR